MGRTKRLNFARTGSTYDNLVPHRSPGTLAYILFSLPIDAVIRYSVAITAPASDVISFATVRSTARTAPTSNPICA